MILCPNCFILIKESQSFHCTTTNRAILIPVPSEIMLKHVRKGTEKPPATNKGFQQFSAASHSNCREVFASLRKTESEPAYLNLSNLE